MINTSLFSLEKATRGSVVLGLVGAGGIGIELKVSLEMFDYDQAATIMGRGVHSFLQKPFRMKDLSQKVRGAIGE